VPMSLHTTGACRATGTAAFATAAAVPAAVPAAAPAAAGAVPLAWSGLGLG
jgi:hypothetical protein